MSFLKNYTISFFKSAAMLMLFSLVFISCKKSKDDVIIPPPPPPPPATIIGKWEGEFGILGGLQDYLGFKIKPNGVLETFDYMGVPNGGGTWELNGTTFKTTFSIGSGAPAIISMGGQVENHNKMSGLFGFGSNYTDAGAWHMTKQP